MTTTKLNNMSIALAQRIADAVAMATTDGNTLTALARMSYLNRAMFKIIDDFWQQLAGDKDKFASIFPELVSTPQVLTLTSGVYTVATPLLDFFVLHQAYVGTTVIRVYPPKYYENLIIGNLPQIAADSNNPAVVQLGTSLNFFPTSTASPSVIYLRQPLDPTTGAYLSQNGNYDSPFLEHWNDFIVSIAQQLFELDAQNNK